MVVFLRCKGSKKIWNCQIFYTFLYLCAPVRLGRTLGARWAHGACMRSHVCTCVYGSSDFLHPGIWFCATGAAVAFCPAVKMQGRKWPRQGGWAVRGRAQRAGRLAPHRRNGGRAGKWRAGLREAWRRARKQRGHHPPQRPNRPLQSHTRAFYGRSGL